MKTTPCKGCGKPIVWAKDEKGQAIPLDPRAPVYDVIEVREGVTCVRSKPGQNVMGHNLASMVSHFATCSKAAQFSGSKRKAAPA